jgi:hypothetical protein
MWFHSWLRNSKSHAVRRPARRKRAPSFRPGLEALEDRTVPSTLTVTNALDDGSAGSLRATIAAAPSGSTIDFSNQLQGHTIVLTGGQLVISKNLDIEGPGANKVIISGNNASRVFDISNSATVTIAGLTIANGSATSTTDPSQQSGGGGLVEAGATVYLTNDVFSNNRALVASGAVEIPGGPGGYGTAIISGTTFIGNQAIGSVNGTTNPYLLFDGFGPGNGTAEGGAIDDDGSLTLTNSTFTNNQALGVPGSDGVNAAGHGGALAVDGTATISGTTFTGNQALGASVPGGFASSQAEGGGVVVFGSAMITGSTFTSNEAIGGAGGVPPNAFAFVGGGGGLLGLNGASLTVGGCTFNGNQAIGGAGGAGGIGSLGIGGGLAVHDHVHLTLSDSFFSHNAAIGGAGGSGAAGGLAVGGGLSVDKTSIATITDIDVAFNQAVGGLGGDGAAGGNSWGGGIAVGGRTLYAGPDPTSVTLSGSTISNNVAVGGNGGHGGNGGNGSGAGVFVGATEGAITPSLTVSASTITNNHAMGGAGNGGGAFGLGVGGGVYNLGSFTFDAFTDITGNHASTSNDDIFT